MIEKALNLVNVSTINVDELEEILNEMSSSQRLEFTRKLSPRFQKKLFQAAEGRRVTIEDIVPVSDTLKEVIHEGTNTLPISRAFQKRFARPARTENKSLVGYNHTSFQSLTSPGYFVGYLDEDNGELVIDYTSLPTEKVESWPKIISNNSGIGFLVWKGMKDRLRRVSKHVTIGRAYKKKPMNAYFVLCRIDAE